MISLILVAIATAAVFAYTAVYLVRVVRDDLFEVPSRFA